MANELFERRTLIEAVNHPDITVRSRFIMETLFPKSPRQVFSDVVDYEVQQARPSLASFRFSGQEARVVSKQSKALKTIKLPYIREKKVLTAQELKNEGAIGQIYTAGAGDVTSVQQAALARELQDLKNRVARRVEWMAAQLLLTGAFTYEDDDVAITVDLGMGSTYKPALSGTALWDSTAADVLGDLDSWNVLINQATGMNASKAILGTKAARAFMKDEKVQAMLDTNNQRVGSMSIDLKSNYIGNIFGIDFFRYSHQYTDDSGSSAEMFATNKLVLIGDQIPVDYLAGMVEEVDGAFAAEYYSKSWVTEDPSERWLLVASRPLPLLKQIGSWVTATVTSA